MCRSVSAVIFCTISTKTVHTVTFRNALHKVLIYIIMKEKGMQIKSHIVKAVEDADYKVRYDTEVKKILSYPRSILLCKNVVRPGT